MAVDGLLAFLLAGAVASAGPSGPGSPAATPDRESMLATTLAVQNALREGRDFMLHGEFRAAVNALEGQLAYINGNQVYLRLLADAYRGCVKDLRLSKQNEEAQKYLRRLLILDRGAILDTALNGGSGPTAAPTNPVAASATPAAAQPTSPAPAKLTATVRAKSAEDSLDASAAGDRRKDLPRALLERADQEFDNHRYFEARSLYEQVSQADKSAADLCRERWAYCKLYFVVDQMNNSTPEVTAWADLEREVRQALDLAPRLLYGKQLLEEIEKRRNNGKAADVSKPAAAVAVRHSPANDGWALVESANFRIFHNQSPELAERAAAVAEKTRAAMQQKWFGGAGDAWSPKCDIYLFATGDDYSKATGAHNSPGHSTIRMENGRLVVSRIDLHCDDRNMLTAVLPHEATHVVMAGEFGERLVPRWADEGMAVLTEPREKVDRYLNNLPRCRQENRLFRLQDLMQLDDYPRNASYVGSFYSQSVSVVDFLSHQQGGPQEFTRFLHDGLRYGYDKALERHYGLHGFSELEQRWNQYAFQTGIASR
ncbi:MAG TPA: hypothetical protein VK395_35380 [Gemmataceae bacterium]|nr:hypothetical protein [Gemmataceae bacterium]